MPTLGEFLAGTAEGLTRAIGTAGQAVGTASNIQSMLANAERLRRERELFQPQLETAKASAEIAKIQAEQAGREQRMLNMPINLQSPTSPSPTLQTQPSSSKVVAEAATQQAISQATQQQLTKPIDIKQIEVSGMVPKQTIQTILSDPVLSQIAVQYDATGRPYTTLNNIQYLDKTLSTISAIESGLTRKVTQSTIQGLTLEKDKLYDELEKLSKNPEKNKDKIQQIQNQIAIANKRIDGAVQYALSSDLKLLEHYIANQDKLDANQWKQAQQLEFNLTKLGLQNEIEQMKLWFAKQKVEQQQHKPFLGTPKSKMILLKDGTTINGTEAFLQDGRKVYYDNVGRQINPDVIYGAFENMVDLGYAKNELNKALGKAGRQTKEPKMIFLNKGPTSQPSTNLLNSPEYTIK
jgi:hypothetical protein